MVRTGSLRGIRTFCVVARYSSFKLAAEELCITTSAVSRQIKELEGYLGVQLFERGTRSLTITAAGRWLYDETEPLIRGIGHATESLLRQREWLTLRVRLPAFFASELFIPRLNTFMSGRSDINIRIETAERQKDATGPETDVSIIVADKAPEGLTAERLFGIRFVPACSPGFLATLTRDIRELLDKSTLIIHRDWPRAWYDWAKAAGVERPKPRTILHFDSMAGVVNAAAQGLGMALVPMPITEGRFKSGALMPAAAQTLDTNHHYYVVHQPQLDQRREVRELKAWLLTEYQTSLRLVAASINK